MNKITVMQFVNVNLVLAVIFIASSSNNKTTPRWTPVTLQLTPAQTSSGNIFFFLKNKNIVSALLLQTKCQRLKEFKI